jgi:ATP/ADP translocase
VRDGAQPAETASRPLALETAPPASYLKRMNYVLALLLPPLSILIAGRPFVAIFVFIVWVPAIIFSGGLTHPMFILLAWILIYQSGEERRHRARLDDRRD